MPTLTLLMAWYIFMDSTWAKEYFIHKLILNDNKSFIFDIAMILKLRPSTQRRFNFDDSDTQCADAIFNLDQKFRSSNCLF